MPGLLNPALHIIKTLPRCDVIADDSHLRVIDVRGDEGTESLLTCSIPELKSHHFVVDIHCFSQEINADRCLIKFEKSLNSKFTTVPQQDSILWNGHLPDT